MAKLKTVAFDAAEFLDTGEAQAAYIQEACATGDPAFIAKSIGDVARARREGAVIARSGPQGSSGAAQA